jgi:hypothetical protein
MSVTSIAARKPDHLPGRAPLAEAIARAAEARQEVSAIKAAIEAATNLAWAGRAKLDAATKAVAAAKREDAEKLADALVHGAGSTPLQSIRRAREEEVEAADAVEAARSAVVRLDRDLKDSEREVGRADKLVRAAIAQVLRPTALQMLEEAKYFRAEFLQRQYAIDAMDLDGFERLSSAVSEAEHRALSASIEGPWRDAIAALKRDADAPLPG